MESAGHEHQPEVSTGLRTELINGREVPVYTFRCSCGHTWDEAYYGGQVYKPYP